MDLFRAKTDVKKGANEQVVLPLSVPRQSVARVTEVRSTSVVASIELLREEGQFERYASALLDHRDEILSCIAGEWLPVAVARAHYEACDALGLSASEQFAMGRAAAQHARTGWVAQALRIVRAVGVTPWSLVGFLDRMWARGMKGGAVAVYRLGPKEARLEFIGCELFQIPYYRNAYRGVIDALGAAFSERHYTQELPRCSADEGIFKTQWV